MPFPDHEFAVILANFYLMETIFIASIKSHKSPMTVRSNFVFFSQYHYIVREIGILSKVEFHQ